MNTIFKCLKAPPTKYEWGGKGGEYRVFLSAFLLLLFLFVAPISNRSINGASNLYAQQPTIVNGLKSALIPGWGEISMGNNSGYIFLAAEVALWSSMFYLQGESDLKLRQAEQFAINRANLRSYDLSDEVRFLMERYNRSGFGPGGYNEFVVTTAKTLFPHDPAAQTKYINENLLDESIYWDWGNSENRVQYRGMRSDSIMFTDYAKAVSGTIIVNHIISFLNAMRVGSQQNRTNNLTIYSGFDLEMRPFVGCVVLF